MTLFFFFFKKNLFIYLVVSECNCCMRDLLFLSTGFSLAVTCELNGS